MKDRAAVCRGDDRRAVPVGGEHRGLYPFCCYWLISSREDTTLNPITKKKCDYFDISSGFDLHV